MRQKIRKIIRPASLVVLFSACTLLAQDFQLRTRVDLVVVPVTVKNKVDRPVTGLTQDDFQIFEDNVRQRITNFTVDPVPISAAILLDTGLSAKSLDKVQRTMPALAGAFSEFDEVAVYRFDTYVMKLADFTTDKLVVQTALDKLKDFQPSAPAVTSGPFSTQGPVINGMPVAPSAQVGSGIPPKHSKVLHDAILTAADDLSKRERDRRRVVLVVTDGQATGNEHSYDETQARLLDQNIQVYAIGMDVAFLARRLSVLEKYTKATGGDCFYLDSLDALERSYAHAMEEARNQYVLGYISNNKPNGSLPVFRQLEVRLSRPAATVLHRKGYYQYP
jgi:VWFA-related protein